MKILIALLIAISFIPVFSQSVISFDVDTVEFRPGQTVELSGSVNAGVAGQPVSIEVKDGPGPPGPHHRSTSARSQPPPSLGRGFGPA